MTQKLKSIAWIEDEAEAFATYVFHLSRYGLTIKFFKTVAEALAEFAKHEEGQWPYQLTIFDIYLSPGWNEDFTEAEAAEAGATLVLRFREKFPNEHVLVLTNASSMLEPGEREKLKNEKTMDKVDLKIRTLPNYFFKLEGSPPKPDVN
jgi:hypothetical protein